MKDLFTKEKIKDITRRLIGTLIIPCAVGLILWIICMIKGVKMFPNEKSFTIFLRGIATVMITTIALAINLNSGRFDFSIGSISVLSSVISAKIVLNMSNGNALIMFVISLVAGLILGTISGVLYVLLKLPPIITSLGVALLYEGMAFAITGGSNVSFFGKTDVSAITSNPIYISLIIIVVLAIIIFIFDHTKFGFDYNALRAGQKQAVNTGIKEIGNAVICYAISGTLMSVVGFLSATNIGTIQVGVLNFGSIGIMFIAFLPMFIGGFIGRYSNDKLGYLLAAITMTLLSMSFSALSTKSSTQSIINAVLLVVFLIYLNNEQIFKDVFTLKHIRNYIKNKKGKESK